jgi:hypothetical protein
MEVRRNPLPFRPDLHRLICRLVRQGLEALGKKANDGTAQPEHRNSFDVERTGSPILPDAKSS